MWLRKTRSKIQHGSVPLNKSLKEKKGRENDQTVQNNSGWSKSTATLQEAWWGGVQGWRRGKGWTFCPVKQIMSLSPAHARIISASTHSLMSSLCLKSSILLASFPKPQYPRALSAALSSTQISVAAPALPDFSLLWALTAPTSAIRPVSLHIETLCATDVYYFPSSGPHLLLPYSLE